MGYSKLLGYRSFTMGHRLAIMGCRNGTSPRILWDIAADTHSAVTIPWDIPSYQDIARSPWDIACLPWDIALIPWDVAMGHRHTYCGMSLLIHTVHCPQAMSTRSRTISCLIKPCPFES